MLSEYVRPEVNFKLNLEKAQRRASVFASSPVQKKIREKPRKKSLKIGKKLDIETITKSYMDPSEYSKDTPIDSPHGNKGGFKMSRFSLLNKAARHNTEYTELEDSYSNKDSGRVIDSHRSKEVTPMKSLTLRKNDSNYDSNPYMDISHLDYTVKSFTIK